MSQEAVESAPNSPQPAGPQQRRSQLIRLPLAVCFVAVLAAGSGALTFWEPLSVWRSQMRARELLSQRRDNEALQVLRAALRDDIDNPETLLLLARTHRRLGNLGRVAALLDRAEAFGGDAQRVERERRLVLAQSGNLRETESYLADLLISADHDAPDVCQAYVQGYFANLKTDQALQLLDVWRESYPNDPQPLFMHAYLLQSMNLPEQAIELYEQGLALGPHVTVMRRRLAESLLEVGQVDRAQEELTRCLEQSPDDAQVRFVLARCAYARGEWQAAAQRLEEALRLDPGHWEARQLMGRVSLAQGDTEAALRDLQAVVDLRPYDFQAREALGRALAAVGRNDEAQPHFQFVSDAEEKMGRLNRLLRQSLQDSDNPDLRYQVGEILFQYGPPEDAARWMRATLELQPDHPGAHRALAAFFQQRGDTAKAGFHRLRAAGDSSSL